jgi:diguanylate cyclase (GGDEF)-like protein
LRGDTAARLGGDEFAVLLENTTGDHAGRIVADRITKALREPILLASRETFAFASIGIASSDHSALTADDLMRHADLAMYRAKRGDTRAALADEPRMHGQRQG